MGAPFGALSFYMATKSDVIHQALTDLGIIRHGGSAPGQIFNYASDRLDQRLLAINEEVRLDFDPTGDNVPDERVFWLVSILANTIAPSFGKARDQDALDHAEARLQRAIKGESDFVDLKQRDF